MTNKFPDNCDLLVTKIVLTKYFKELLSITFRRKKMEGLMKVKNARKIWKTRELKVVQNKKSNNDAKINLLKASKNLRKILFWWLDSFAFT